MNVGRIVVIVGALAGCQSVSTPPPRQMSSQESKFGLCDAEGFRALNTARQYLVLKDSKERIQSYLGSSDSAKAFAQELFSRADSGEVRNHAVFATEKLIACTEREGLHIGKPREVVTACYARADIPFFLAGVKPGTPNKSDAINKVSVILKDRDVYPGGLIAATADIVYQPGALDVQKLMGTVFWSCVYNNEWNQSKK